MGRFLTQDPFPGFSSLPSTLHPYSYALNNPINRIDPSGRFPEPFLVLAAASFVLGFGVNTWMQYQAKHGWCGFDPLAALEWGISAAFISTLAALTAIEALALLGMGLQGIGVLINWLPAFSAGSSLSATAGSAAVWFMTGQSRMYTRPGATVSSRAKELRIALPAGSRGRVTMATGIVEDIDGIRYVAIGTSEGSGYIRPGVRELIKPGEIIVSGFGHSEANIVSWANTKGWTVIAIGAGRPMCEQCASTLNKICAILVTVRK